MGHPWIESTDHIQGTAPVLLRVRLVPRKPEKIIAVPFLLTADTGNGGKLKSTLTHITGGLVSEGQATTALFSSQLPHSQACHFHDILTVCELFYKV